MRWWCVRVTLGPRLQASWSGDRSLRCNGACRIFRYINQAAPSELSDELSLAIINQRPFVSEGLSLNRQKEEVVCYSDISTPRRMSALLALGKNTKHLDPSQSEGDEKASGLFRNEPKRLLSTSSCKQPSFTTIIYILKKRTSFLFPF